MNQIKEIKNNLDIVDIVSGYLQLAQAGTNFRACCPFHQEKTPSFMVSREKQIWHCFGCNEGGDVFKFVMKIEGLEFKDALKLLADKAGIKLQQHNSALDTHKNRLLKINELATEFYNKQLLTSVTAEETRRYLKSRGLNSNIAKEFELGFASKEWEDLYRHLLQKGFKDQEIFNAGLSLKKKSGNGYFDRFRGRIMIPIKDTHGRVCGFTGRLMPEEEKNSNAGGKYMNTPQTLVYDKSRILYGLNWAKQAIKENDAVIIVEGNMDVITCHQFGFKNVVASSGTALTIYQLRLLKRFTKNIILSFDSDLAGENAARRGIDNALKEEMNIKVIEIPEWYGKDPDECIRKNKDIWEGAIKNAKEIMEYHFQKATKDKDLRKLAVQQKVRSELIPEINKLQDGVARVFWVKKLGEILNVQEGIIYDELEKNNRQNQNSFIAHQKEEYKPVAKATKGRESLLKERLLAILLVFPDKIVEMKRELGDNFHSESYNFLYKNFILCYNKTGLLEYSTLKEYLLENNIDEKTKNLFHSVTMLSERDFKSLDFKLCEEEFRNVLRELKFIFIKKQREQLEIEMKEAEKSGNTLRIQELSKKFKELI